MASLAAAMASEGSRKPFFAAGWPSWATCPLPASDQPGQFCRGWFLSSHSSSGSHVRLVDFSKTDSIPTLFRPDSDVSLRCSGTTLACTPVPSSAAGHCTLGYFPLACELALVLVAHPSSELSCLRVQASNRVSMLCLPPIW